MDGINKRKMNLRDLRAFIANSSSECEPSANSDWETAKGIACVNLSNYISKVLGIGYREPDESIVLSELPSAVFLKFDKDKLASFVEQINETYENEKAIFQ